MEKLIVMLIAGLGYAILQYFEAKKAQAKQGIPPVAGMGRRPNPAADAPIRPAGEGQRPMSPTEEVEEFLRRALNRGGQQPAAGERRPPAPPRSSPDAALAKHKRKQEARQRRLPKESVPKPPDEPASRDPRSKQKRSGSQFEPRTVDPIGGLGKKPDIVSNLGQFFGHSVGHLGGAAAAEAEASSTGPQRFNQQTYNEQNPDQPNVDRSADSAGKHPVLSLLSNPAGMQAAIVLGEIMPRPEHRWQ